jgi:predicted nucleic acid-binding protein
VTLLVDTSVWSLALRRDSPPALAEVDRLRQALESGEEICSTGLILQELLQGFRGPKARTAIVDRFETLPLIAPSRRDHINAADLRTSCRRRGIQVGTIDALIAQLCIRHELTLLSTDRDFTQIAAIVPFALWRAS